MQNIYTHLWPDTDPALPTAVNEAIAFIRERIQSNPEDPSRPRCHFTPPAGAMIDAWGGILHDGYHHLFYDLNTRPVPALGGIFGHLRTRDMVHFEQLPPALTPCPRRDELRLNDGCLVIRDDGTPLMYYTSVFNDSTRAREHLPAIGSPDLIYWKRLPDSAAITLENHGGPSFHGAWSDPVIFTENGRTCMIISKCVTLDGKNQIPIYEATDDTLLNWRYRGIFFDDTGEVINFIKLDGKWVLIYCPYSDPVWFAGSFDPNTGRFTAETSGILSHGYIEQGNEFGRISRGFYATTTFTGSAGETVIFGWLSGFNAPRGWDGCISFPRILALDADQRLRMDPHPGLALLRRECRPVTPNNPLECGECFELECRFTIPQDGRIVLEGGEHLTISISRRQACLNGITAELEPERGPVNGIRLFVDVSTAELFLNTGQGGISLAIPRLGKNARLRLEAENARIDEAYLYRLALD